MFLFLHGLPFPRVVNLPTVISVVTNETLGTFTKETLGTFTKETLGTFT